MIGPVAVLPVAITPPQESIQEIRFITNSFSAEYGRSAGGVIAAAGKSGANQLHGSVYDYLKNDKLNANSWANNRNNVLRGRQRHNEYGFTLSGPVYVPRVYDGRNKTFFFFNWEQINDHGVSTPTANVSDRPAKKSGDFSQTFTSANALIKIYDPLTTVADPTQSSGYSRSVFREQCHSVEPHRSDHEEGDRVLPRSDARDLSHAPNQLVTELRQYHPHRQVVHASGPELWRQNRLFFRYGHQTSPRKSPYTNIAFPGETTNGGGNQESIAYTYGLSDTQTFSSKLVGEFRFGYTRSVIKTDAPQRGIRHLDPGTAELPQGCVHRRHLSTDVDH